MQIDPVKEWQRLTTLYRELGDVELRELAMQFGDLTDAVQQVLSDELKKRGLPDPLARNKPASVSMRLDRHPPEKRNPLDEQPEDEDSDDGALKEFTWKTLFCHCETTEQAWQ
jgi:hypothetical protein